MRPNPASAVTNYVDILRGILELLKELVVSTDIIFINKLPLPAITSKVINFTTIEYISNRSESLLAKSII